MSNVIILQGIPGSGKSTFAKSLASIVQALKINVWQREYCADRDGDVIVVSADHFFTDDEGVYNFDPKRIGDAHAACLRKFTSKVLSERDLTIVVDNTNITNVEMAPYATLAAAFGHTCEIHTFHADPQTAFERCTHGVPKAVIQRMADSLETPLARFGTHIPHTK
jgi:predicted kinase